MSAASPLPALIMLLKPCKDMAFGAAHGSQSAELSDAIPGAAAVAMTLSPKPKSDFSQKTLED